MATVSSTPDRRENGANGWPMMTVMTGDDSATPATGDTVSGTGWEIRFLDLDVVDLIAEVDAICARLSNLTGVRPGRQPTAAPCSGRRGAAGRAMYESPRGAHPSTVRAVQRSPPPRN
jgi:hypothetical protein